MKINIEKKQQSSPSPVSGPYPFLLSGLTAWTLPVLLIILTTHDLKIAYYIYKSSEE